MLSAKSRTKKVTLFLVLPAVASLTISLLSTIIPESSFPKKSFAAVDNSNSRPSVTEAFAPSRMTFDGKKLTDSDDIIKYRWNFGDGETAEGRQVSHFFDAPGIYSVTLQAKTTTGAIEEQQVVVNVGATGAALSQTNTGKVY